MISAKRGEHQWQRKCRSHQVWRACRTATQSLALIPEHDVAGITWARRIELYVFIDKINGLASI
jgi:hypothetical protein